MEYPLLNKRVHKTQNKEILKITNFQNNITDSEMSQQGSSHIPSRQLSSFTECCSNTIQKEQDETQKSQDTMQHLISPKFRQCMMLGDIYEIDSFDSGNNLLNLAYPDEFAI